MSLFSGKIENDGTLTVNSMSATIERAINDLVPPGAHENPQGRRKLALAIARGVLKHLSDNASAVQVTVPDTGTGGTTHDQASKIAVDLGGWS
jgi:hypothetical protein